MIEAIYIKNYKMYERETIQLDKNNLIIGENDSGKSTILEALDIFFNQEKIPNTELIRDQTLDVEIGVFIDGINYKKTYTGKVKKETFDDVIFKTFPMINYIFLDSQTRDVSKLINELTVAKTIENIDEDTKGILEKRMNESANEVLKTIDPDFIVVNSDRTDFIIEPQLKLDAAIKFKVSSSGIPLEGRGSGYQKNVLYSLLTKGDYQNVILGIDEIENSLSINNARTLIKLITEKFAQTLITTHSTRVLAVSLHNHVIPRFGANNVTLMQLYNSLDNTEKTLFLLVEGKFDLFWVKESLKYINHLDDYDLLLLPGGGTNMDTLAKELIGIGKKVVLIKDGDVNHDVHSISKEIIELYTPLEVINEEFNLELTIMPNSKEEFFRVTTSETRNENSVKNKLSRKCHEFINEDSELVEEIKRIIRTQM